MELPVERFTRIAKAMYPQCNPKYFVESFGDPTKDLLVIERPEPVGTWDCLIGHARFLAMTDPELIALLSEAFTKQK